MSTTSATLVREVTANVWELVYVAAERADRTALREVCRSARDGVDRKRRHILIWGHPFPFHLDPSWSDMLRLLRRLPNLRTVQLRFSNQKGCLQALRAVRSIADSRGMKVQMEGEVRDETSSLSVREPRLRGCRFEKALKEARGFEDAYAFMSLKPCSYV